VQEENQIPWTFRKWRSGFQAFTVGVGEMTVIWVITECRLVLLQHFFGVYCLHAQGDSVVQTGASANYLNHIQCSNP